MRNGIYKSLSLVALLFSFFVIVFSQQTLSGNLVGNLTGSATQFNTTENVACELPPKIELSGADTIFDRGSNLTIYALVTDRWNNPVDYWTYINLSIYAGNTLIFQPTRMLKNATGWYYLNYTISTTASYGSYSILVEGDPCGVVTKATTGFRVAVMNVSLVTGSLEELLVYLQKINTTTVAINSTVLEMNANYSRYFSVWNATFYYWNNSYFVNWNSTIMNLNNNWSDLWSYWQCTGPGANNMVCSYLLSINTTQTAYFREWNTTFYFWNNTYFLNWNSTIMNLNRNISDLRNYWDCSGVGTNSLVCNYLDEINDTTHSGTTDILREVNQTIHYIWERFERVNATQQIHNETVLSAILSKTSNIKLWYNLTIPLKQGYTTDDYLPIRIKYWFINLGSDIASASDDSCVNQARTFESAFPHCNAIIAQYVGKGSSTVNFNVTLQPSLGIGNYSIVRELEIDPNNVWISYNFGTIGSFEVTDDMQVNLTELEIQASGSEDGKWSYIDQSGLEKFRINVPTQSMVRLWGRLTDVHSQLLLSGSLKVEITDTFLPNVKWSEIYNDNVKNGVFDILLGAKKPLSLISGREYQLDVTACNGRIFDTEKYACDTFTSYVTPK